MRYYLFIIVILLNGCMFMIKNCKNSSGIYTSYDELEKYEKKGIDYTIKYKKRNSKIGIMAIHGGGIEPMTDIIAKDIAKNDYNFYAFIGLKKKNNLLMHITSTCFDEPISTKFLRSVDVVVSIHGCRSTKDIIHIGGLNKNLAELIRENLIKKGFEIGNCENPEISGENKNNICNKCKDRGVQIEISTSLRERFHGLGRESRYYKKFISAIRKAVTYYTN